MHDYSHYVSQAFWKMAGVIQFIQLWQETIDPFWGLGYVSTRSRKPGIQYALEACISSEEIAENGKMNIKTEAKCYHSHHKKNPIIFQFTLKRKTLRTSVIQCWMSLIVVYQFSIYTVVLDTVD